MQNKLKICKTDFLQNRKMCFLAYLKNSSKSVLQIFFTEILAVDAIHPKKLIVKISLWVVR